MQNFVAPFATLEGSPLILSDGDSTRQSGQLKISTLAVLEPDSSGGHGVWLQTSFYIGTTGTGCEAVQQSQIVVALGSASNQNGLTGERRGGARSTRSSFPALPVIALCPITSRPTTLTTEHRRSTSPTPAASLR